MRRIVSSLALVAVLSPSFAFAVDADLNAAPNTSAVSAQSTSLGEYAEVSCDSNAVFSQYSCQQCFTGRAVKAGERLTGLYDNWHNTSSNAMIAYKDEQKAPKMHAIGDTTWVSTPSDESQVWKHASDVAWTPAKDRQSFLLVANQKIRFYEADLGAGYTLEKTSQKNGDVVGLIQYPIMYHTIDMTSGKESDIVTHNECMAFTLSKEETPTTPSEPSTPPPPPGATQTETGPAQTLLLIVAAFFIAFGLMFSLRKRV